MDKKNIPLMIGLAIPILMIIFVAASIYLPGLFATPPKFDFLYTVGGDYHSKDLYSLEHGKLVKNEITYPEKYTWVRKAPKLFVHDVAKNESYEISFEQAQKLVLNSNIKSPDGFEIVRAGHADNLFSFFFGRGGDYRNRYIKGHLASKKLNLQTDVEHGYYYYYNFRFLGWIIK